MTQATTIARFRVRLKTPLLVSGTVMAEAGLVLDAYTSPGYVYQRSSWVLEAGGKVIEVFREDVELLTAGRIPLTDVPELILKYIKPDHQGHTTMPYQLDHRVYRSTRVCRCS